LYKKIIDKKLDLSKNITFNLDEYYPINNSDPASYHTYMHTNFFNHVNILPQNINLLNGSDVDVESYRNKILKYPIDIAFLGIGINGHIAFNEPGTPINSTTRFVDLTPSTKLRNMVNYDSALTVGISEILSSKKIIMMGTGASKADIIYDLFHSTKFNPIIPATALLNHSNCDAYVDDEAFSKVLSLVNPEFLLYDKILIFSPHPDDDVIGMGATIKKFLQSKKDCIVCYQTSGANGGDIDIRQTEAINSLRILGLENTDNIIFGNSPFYANKTNISEQDELYFMNIIQRVQPDAIFFAGDINDPHQTHLHCHNILLKCFEQLPTIPIWKYYSAWNSPESYDKVEYFDHNMMQLKIESIKAHASQLNPKFGGELKKEFYEVIEERNKKSSKIEHLYMESFNMNS